MQPIPLILMNLTEAAFMLSVKISTARTWANEARLPGVVRLGQGKLILFNSLALTARIADGCHKLR
jgi:hypothetical protein